MLLIIEISETDSQYTKKKKKKKEDTSEKSSSLPRKRVNCFEIRQRLRVENGKRSMGRSGVNYGETTICNWSESHCSQWGHSFAHCALRLIYFRLYSIADRSKSPARGLPLTDVNSTVHCTTDRSVQSRRSSLFDVNLRWSTVVRSSLVSFASRLYSLSLSLSFSRDMHDESGSRHDL